MQPFKIEKELFIPADIQRVWKFFSDPHNLQKITPETLRFKVIQCPDVAEIFEGMRIEYRVSPILNIPLKWVTLIKSVQPLQSFTDLQLKGPYTLWEHTHTFEPQGNGVLMKDKVLYKLPFGPLGLLAHSLFVKKQVTHIFEHREKVIRNIFP
jgi:ligand-binding SRPBCC domain-containing protein